MRYRAAGSPNFFCCEPVDNVARTVQMNLALARTMRTFDGEILRENTRSANY